MWDVGVVFIVIVDEEGGVGSEDFVIVDLVVLGGVVIIDGFDS